ncbi:MAG: hypothetical protein U5K74_01105 [Gemmatimonadaceae bacterium]|nr:hypothetical protein [Gemmatimonadaceae bacterium]
MAWSTEPVPTQNVIPSHDEAYESMLSAMRQVALAAGIQIVPTAAALLERIGGSD